MTSSERELILRCLMAFLRHCGAELLPKASMHTVHAVIKLLDSARTQACHVSLLLELLREALAGCKTQELGQVLPDLLDVLLGWAVDPTADQATRCAPQMTSPKVVFYGSDTGQASLYSAKEQKGSSAMATQISCPSLTCIHTVSICAKACS